MDIPKGFKPGKDLEGETKKLQKERIIRKISDFVLEDRIPDDYFLFSKQNIYDVPTSYEHMLPSYGLKDDLRLIYKSSTSNSDMPYFRIDVLEFESKEFVSKNLEKFYKTKKKINSRITFPVINDLLIKDMYVVFFRGFNEDILQRFMYEYKKRFGMKEIEINFILR